MSANRGSVSGGSDVLACFWRGATSKPAAEYGGSALRAGRDGEAARGNARGLADGGFGSASGSC